MKHERSVNIVLKIADDDFIFFHRALKKFLDQRATWHQIESWRMSDV